jgi:hypothetical protein
MPIAPSARGQSDRGFPGTLAAGTLPVAEGAGRLRVPCRRNRAARWRRDPGPMATSTFSRPSQGRRHAFGALGPHVPTRLAGSRFANTSLARTYQARIANKRNRCAFCHAGSDGAAAAARLPAVGSSTVARVGKVVPVWDVTAPSPPARRPDLGFGALRCAQAVTPGYCSRADADLTSTSTLILPACSNTKSR